MDPPTGQDGEGEERCLAFLHTGPYKPNNAQHELNNFTLNDFTIMAINGRCTKDAIVSLIPDVPLDIVHSRHCTDGWIQGDISEAKLLSKIPVFHLLLDSFLGLIKVYQSIANSEQLNIEEARADACLENVQLLLAERILSLEGTWNNKTQSSDEGQTFNNLLLQMMRREVPFVSRILKSNQVLNAQLFAHVFSSNEYRRRNSKKQQLTTTVDTVSDSQPVNLTSQLEIR